MAVHWTVSPGSRVPSKSAAVFGHGQVGEGDVVEGDVAGVGDVEGVVDVVADVGPAVGFGHVRSRAPSLSSSMVTTWGMSTFSVSSVALSVASVRRRGVLRR